MAVAGLTKCMDVFVSGESVLQGWTEQMVCLEDLFFLDDNFGKANMANAASVLTGKKSIFIANM